MTLPPGPLKPPDLVQEGIHYLEDGSFTLIEANPKRGTVSLKLELTMREGEARHPKDHRVTVRCTIDAPLKIQ